jgi:hypothetical protein
MPVISKSKSAKAAKDLQAVDTNHDNNYRLYSFINMYLSSIQQGIQTAHLVSELHNEYKNNNRMFNEWCDKDKTIIVLNGGMSASLKQDVNTLYRYPAYGYPMTDFSEESVAIGSIADLGNSGSKSGALVAWGIVLPQRVWDAKPVFMRSGKSGKGPVRRTGEWEFGVLGTPEYKKYQPGSFEVAILEVMENKSLAR